MPPILCHPSFATPRCHDKHPSGSPELRLRLRLRPPIRPATDVQVLHTKIQGALESSSRAPSGAGGAALGAGALETHTLERPTWHQQRDQRWRGRDENQPEEVRGGANLSHSQPLDGTRHHRGSGPTFQATLHLSAPGRGPDTGGREHAAAQRCRAVCAVRSFRVGGG